jgi:hypothetical protein
MRDPSQVFHSPRDRLPRVRRYSKSSEIASWGLLCRGRWSTQPLQGPLRRHGTLRSRLPLQIRLLHEALLANCESVSD